MPSRPGRALSLAQTVASEWIPSSTHWPICMRHALPMRGFWKSLSSSSRPLPTRDSSSLVVPPVVAGLGVFLVRKPGSRASTRRGWVLHEEGARTVARFAQLDFFPAERFHFLFHPQLASFFLPPCGKMQGEKLTPTVPHQSDTYMSERLQNNDNAFFYDNVGLNGCGSKLNDLVTEQ